MNRGLHVKWLALLSGIPQLEVRYRIVNAASESIAFLSKRHRGIGITPAHRLDLPGGVVTPVSLECGTIIGDRGPFAWPIVRDRKGCDWDLSVLPAPADRHREFVYVRDFPEGWCGARNERTGSAFRLYFSPRILPSTWLFMTFGGWRHHYTVVVERCGDIRKDLTTAHRRGTCARLSSGESFTCTERAALED